MIMLNRSLTFAFRAVAIAALLGGLLPDWVSAEPTAASFVVSGAVASPHTWTAATLQATFSGQIKTIDYTLKGVAHTAHAVPLETVIEAAKPKVAEHVKHGMLQEIVTVTGADGYTVVFSWGELLPDFGHEAVWVAVDEDGRPLPGDDGPVELIVPGDVKAARWVHAVASIVVSAP